MVCYIQADDKEKNMDGNKKLFDIDGIHMLGNFDNGAVIGLDDEGYAYVETADSKLCDEKKQAEIDNAMKEMGFLDKEQEKKIDAAYLHVIDACNLHCVGCYSFIEDRNTSKKLSCDEIKKILDGLKQVGVQKIVISGGEPFIRNDLEEICKYAKEVCRFEFLTIITNGTMNIERYYPVLRYINQLNISIDGYSEKTYFIRDKGIMPKVLDTVRRLKDLIEINMIVTLHRKNIKYMKEYNELAKKMGVRFSFSIFTVDETNPLFNEYGRQTSDFERVNFENSFSN